MTANTSATSSSTIMRNYDRKSPQMRQALTPLLGDGLFVSDGDLWRERRNSCAPAMRSELLPLFVPRIAETAAQMADEWAEQDGTKIDALREMARLTARIIGRTIFGDDTPTAEAEQVVQGFSLYQKSIEQMDLRVIPRSPLTDVPLEPAAHARPPQSHS